MKVREIMKSAPVTVTESTPLGDAARTMTEHHIRHLPVVRGQRLCGILSERDVLVGLISGAIGGVTMLAVSLVQERKSGTVSARIA